jgi:cytochrome c oxidase subunit 1
MTIADRPVFVAPYVATKAASSAGESTRRLTLANVWVAVIAFAVATAMAVMQAMSRANLDLPGRSPRMYYLSVTAHGVLMALVFTTFFIMALGWAVVRQDTGAMKWPRASWIAFWAAVAGVGMTTWAILTHRASVLYTFYPPLQAHPAFYIGLTIVVVASLEWAASILATWFELRRTAPQRPVSLAMHATAANAMLWMLCTLGVAAEMVFQLIPWSLGWVKTIDPLLARTLFWFFGHPLVYFWILPAYTIWYTVLPREAGGFLFSDRLGRMVFTLFLVLSTPVGFHHQFQDPGISAGWKLFHTFNTMVISFPSLVTAFTICASLEVAGRLRGGKGLFGWIGKLPWGNPLVSCALCAMLLFLIGGFGGSINAAYALNSVVHNTAWVQGHFHLTVGSAAALTYMGAMYWMVPRLRGVSLQYRPLAQVQPFLWMLGMTFFSLPNHITGLMGLPRRVYDATYGGAPQAQMWSELTAISAAGGIIVFTSALCFVLSIGKTLLQKSDGLQTESLVWAEPLEEEAPSITAWDHLGRWWILAAVLVVIAYAIPLIGIFSMTRFGSPGFKPF